MSATPDLAPARYRVGTLSYTPPQLVRPFAWLLAGDFVFTIINQIEPVILPIILKQHGADDRAIALLLSSIPAVINLIVNPLVSYHSDRTHTRWGRRIPYLAVATPLVSLFLILTPFAPEFARWAGGPVLGMFALLIGIYQVFQYVIASVYFYLLRDVVPMPLMGRFLSLLRIFSALGLATMNYWLLGYAETAPRALFIGVGVMNLLGFGALCLSVREGDYAHVPDRIGASSRGLTQFAFVRNLLNFAVESFSHPVYRWTYLARLCFYACAPMMAFVILFARNDLKLDLATAGRTLAWPNFVWPLLAYPVGRCMDRWGAIRMMQYGLAGLVLGYAASFFLVAGPRTFGAVTMITGLCYWVVNLAQLMLAQVIFHPARMGQLSSANALVQALVIALITGPLTGQLLHALEGTSLRLIVPGVGAIASGHYRFIYLLLGLTYGLALLALFRVREHWQKLGGAAGYVPPL